MEESQKARPEWAQNAMTVGALKKHLEEADDSWIVAFPVDSEGNDFKYAVDVSTGHLCDIGGEFEQIDMDEPDWEGQRRDPNDPDYVRVVFIEPYN